MSLAEPGRSFVVNYLGKFLAPELEWCGRSQIVHLGSWRLEFSASEEQSVKIRQIGEIRIPFALPAGATAHLHAFRRDGSPGACRAAAPRSDAA